MKRSMTREVGRGHTDGIQGLRGNGMKTSRRSGADARCLSYWIPPVLAILALLLTWSSIPAKVPPPIIEPAVVAGDPDDPGNPQYCRQGGADGIDPTRVEAVSPGAPCSRRGGVVGVRPAPQNPQSEQPKQILVELSVLVRLYLARLMVSL